MKLAEGLLLRADLQKKIASLKERIVKNAVVQEGEKPSEDPTELMREAEAVLGQLEKLIFAINKANLENSVGDGTTLTAALARRDVLALRHSLLNAVAAAAAQTVDQYSLSEIKRVSTVEVAKVQKKADEVAKGIRELNAAIQETNWKIEIEV